MILIPVRLAWLSAFLELRITANTSVEHASPMPISDRDLKDGTGVKVRRVPIANINACLISTGLMKVLSMTTAYVTQIDHFHNLPSSSHHRATVPMGRIAVGTASVSLECMTALARPTTLFSTARNSAKSTASRNWRSVRKVYGG